MQRTQKIELSRAMLAKELGLPESQVDLSPKEMRLILAKPRLFDLTPPVRFTYHRRLEGPAREAWRGKVLGDLPAIAFENGDEAFGVFGDTSPTQYASVLKPNVLMAFGMWPVRSFVFESATTTLVDLRPELTFDAFIPSFFGVRTPFMPKRRSLRWIQRFLAARGLELDAEQYAYLNLVPA